MEETELTRKKDFWYPHLVYLFFLKNLLKKKKKSNKLSLELRDSGSAFGSYSISASKSILNQED